MRKNHLLLLASLAAFLGGAYLFFLYRVHQVSTSLAAQELAGQEALALMREPARADFLAHYPEYPDVFDQCWAAGRASSSQDSTVRFLMYASSLPYTKYEAGFYECLALKCRSEVSKRQSRAALDKALRPLQRQYGDEVGRWVGKLGDLAFYHAADASDGRCEACFDDDRAYSFNPAAVGELKEFLAGRAKARAEATRQSAEARARHDRRMAQEREELPPGGHRIFDEEFKGVKLLLAEDKTFSYSGKYLGWMSDEFPLVEFDERKFNVVLEYVHRDAYQNHSLPNGTTPYAYCYGTANGCSGFGGCSEIVVNTPSNSDVLVTIKQNDIVQRHAYIRAGNSYTFHLPNGVYQPFFYYGMGWNPKRRLEGTDCGNLQGGFMLNEHVGKDDAQGLKNQILTYSLTLQLNGNFSTRASNLQEAL
jgi:hypothetical protein